MSFDRGILTRISFAKPSTCPLHPDMPNIYYSQYMMFLYDIDNTAPSPVSKKWVKISIQRMFVELKKKWVHGINQSKKSIWIMKTFICHAKKYRVHSIDNWLGFIEFKKFKQKKMPGLIYFS